VSLPTIVETLQIVFVGRIWKR